MPHYALQSLHVVQLKCIEAAGWAGRHLIGVLIKLENKSLQQARIKISKFFRIQTPTIRLLPPDTHLPWGCHTSGWMVTQPSILHRTK